VGVEPLVSDAGLPEELATSVVSRCASEAKLVAVEQEKKKAEQAAAARNRIASPEEVRRRAEDNAVMAALGLKGVDGVASAERPMPQTENGTSGVALPEDAAEDADAASSRMPGPTEAAPGGSPEIMVHKEHDARAAGEELSPEEQAMNIEVTEEPSRGPRVDDEGMDAAALAEGRDAPPKTDL
jgi:hypothetical protein